jgi:histidyl-tRNA synthetase
VMAEAPKILDRLEGEDAEHFAAVRRLLDEAGIGYRLDPTLVRGLDYYTRTVFSFDCDRLGAQSEIGGGGRYDALIEQLGGPPTPANGWAAGVERIMLALGEQPGEPRRDVFVAAPDGQRERALALVTELRRAGLSAEMDLAGRGLKGQMRHADRIGARQAVILQDDGPVELRDMESGEQREVAPEGIVEEISRSSRG